ncbi:MAG: hypothetical protein NUV67_05345 [archaeon]|nr:hypothetical protein [archaeon]
MRRIIYFRVAGRDVHMPKLIGSFIIFAAFLMFVQASAAMFDSWDNLKYYDSCIQRIDGDASLSDQRLSFNSCAETLHRSTGIVVREESARLTVRQFWFGLLGPIASILFWLAVLFIGMNLYRTGDLIIPIEETIREVPDEPIRSFRRKK